MSRPGPSLHRPHVFCTGENGRALEETSGSFNSGIRHRVSVNGRRGCMSRGAEIPRDCC